MILPRKMPVAVCYVVYPLVCSLHGFLFGILYAPAQAIFFKLNFSQTLAWISTGAIFDVIHGISNFAVGFLIVPFTALLKRLAKRYRL
jgi:energy-coupling factor transport system substrate-specific component